MNYPQNTLFFQMKRVKWVILPLFSVVDINLHMSRICSLQKTNKLHLPSTESPHPVLLILRVPRKDTYGPPGRGELNDSPTATCWTS